MTTINLECKIEELKISEADLLIFTVGSKEVVLSREVLQKIRKDILEYFKGNDIDIPIMVHTYLTKVEGIKKSDLGK